LGLPKGTPVKFVVFGVTSFFSFLCTCGALRGYSAGRWGDVAGFGLVAAVLGVVALMQLRGDGEQ